MNINQATQQTLKQINQLIGQKVTIYTVDSYATIQRIECKINSVESSSYAQYDDGIKLTIRQKRKRSDQRSWHVRDRVIWGYRGWECKGRDGSSRQHGKELVIVPGWNNDLRLKDEVISQNSKVTLSLTHSIYYKNFFTVKDKARQIKSNIVFEVS